MVPGHRGRHDAALSPSDVGCDLRRGDAATRPRARRWWSSPARNTAPAPSRDWAAKGTNLLGVRAVIVESFERIHRSNLVGMGVLPLQFEDGTSWQTLGLKGDETRHHRGVAEVSPRQKMLVDVAAADGSTRSVPVYAWWIRWTIRCCRAPSGIPVCAPLARGLISCR